MWRRVPCEQPLHTGQSILSPRRNPMLMVAGCSCYHSGGESGKTSRSAHSGRLRRPKGRAERFVCSCLWGHPPIARGVREVFGSGRGC
jgi:hypothetical protein